MRVCPLSPETQNAPFGSSHPARQRFGPRPVQPAQKTEAFQLNNNLLLSDRAHADSKPNLEIFADDVKASHGSTVGQLDKEQIFYMKTRGFSEEEATEKLLKCQLALEIENIIKAKGWTQAQAAKKLGVVQPRISEIMTTQAHRFTLNMLIKYLVRLGKEVRVLLKVVDVSVGAERVTVNIKSG